MNRYRPYYFDPWKQQRYDAEMSQNSSGDWVRYEDYAKALSERLQQLHELKESFARLEKKCAALALLHYGSPSPGMECPDEPTDAPTCCRARHEVVDGALNTYILSRMVEMSSTGD